MGKHLVVVGAGHAHMTVLKRLAEFTAAGHRVSVIGPGPYHYYSGMGPGMLSGIYRPEEIRFDVRAMAMNGGAAFIEDQVVKIDAAARKLTLAGGSAVAYDIASFNTGSGVPLDERWGKHANVVPVKPIERLLEARLRILVELANRPLSIVVAGGGPAGLEITGNLRRLAADRPAAAEITLVAGGRLLADFAPSVRGKALRALVRLGVKLREGERVASAGEASVGLDSGQTLPADFLFMAVGVRPSNLFQDSGLPVGGDGGLRVNRHLQSVAHPEIFGGGDCISFEPQPLARVGVYAVRQNPVLLQNLQHALSGRPLIDFYPQKKYLLAFNMGDGTAIVQWKSLVFDGRLGFLLKDYLDRSFMRRFQPAGAAGPPAPGVRM